MRRRLAALLRELQPQFVERRLAKQSLNLRADLMIRSVAVVRARLEVEATHPKVVGGVVAATILNAQRLVLGERVLDADGDVGLLRWTKHDVAHGVVDSGDRVKRYGQLLETEARRLGEMVERVLQYAGIESGLATGARAPLAPTEVIEGAIESSLTLLGSEEITIERNFIPNPPAVVGDAAALRSAIQNLIANAVKYGGRDRWVGVRVEHGRQRRRPEVWITISDHGDGIPASELPHIFDPFYRGADAVARQVHGNGLGLSLVRQIVAAHGGRVTVTTRAGAGSSFTIALPSAEPDQRATAVASQLQTTHS